MRINRLIVACAMLAVITVLPVYGQQQRPAATPAAGGGGGPMPESKVAVIFTDAFLDQKNGIGRINSIAANLEREFTPRKNELDGLQTRIKTATDEIAKLQNSNAPIDPKSMQAKIDALDTMKKDFQRKAEDAQAAYGKRQQEVLGPLQEDIGRALEAYAKQRGITVLIDASRVPLIYAADGLDITRAFILDYNSKNPATASAR